jgi:hypothetical protein
MLAIKPNSAATPLSVASGSEDCLSSMPAHEFSYHTGTSPSLSPYLPISSNEKFKIASEDALDPGGIVVAAAAGGVAQLLNSNRVLGQEVSGYGRYFAAAYENHVIGDFMTDDVSTHACFIRIQDTFRKSTGSGAHV